MNKKFSLQWHLTNRCDQRCRHCYIWQKEGASDSDEEPTLDQAEKIINEFILFCQKMEVDPHFFITGGDPLLYPYIWEVLGILKSRKICFSILGNPFHLTFENLSLLKGFGCVNYQMSLDGLKETHDEMRKPGSFEATLKALLLLHQFGIKSSIMSTVSLLNYKEIPGVAKVCIDNGVGSFAFARYCPTNGDTENNIAPTTYRQFLSTMWSLYNEFLDSKTSFFLKDHLWTPFLYENGLYELYKEDGLVFDGCRCGLAHMTLLPDGTVYACRRFDSPVGNIERQSFEDIFFSSEMEVYRQIDRLSGCGACELLKYCRGCHAVAAGTSGSFFDKDPQCWRC